MYGEEAGRDSLSKTINRVHLGVESDAKSLTVWGELPILGLKATPGPSEEELTRKWYHQAHRSRCQMTWKARRGSFSESQVVSLAGNAVALSHPFPCLLSFFPKPSEDATRRDLNSGAAGICKNGSLASHSSDGILLRRWIAIWWRALGLPEQGKGGLERDGGVAWSNLLVSRAKGVPAGQWDSSRKLLWEHCQGQELKRGPERGWLGLDLPPLRNPAVQTPPRAPEGCAPCATWDMEHQL